MHSMIARGLVFVVAVAACGTPTSPTQHLVDDGSIDVELARHRPLVPATMPDSAGIPPSPIPPIVEEAPADLDGTQ